MIPRALQTTNESSLVIVTKYYILQ